MPPFKHRRDRLKKLLREKDLPAMLVTNYTNVTYLTGFTGDDSYLLVSPRAEVIISDERYREQLEDECPDLELEIRQPGGKMLDSVQKVLSAAGVTQLSIEAGSMTVDFRERLGEKLKQVQFANTAGLVESLRAVKDAQEIEQIREAIQFAERAFAVIRASLRPEMTEKQIADELEHQIRLFGGR